MQGKQQRLNKLIWELDDNRLLSIDEMVIDNSLFPPIGKSNGLGKATNSLVKSLLGSVEKVQPSSMNHRTIDHSILKKNANNYHSMPPVSGLSRDESEKQIPKSKYILPRNQENQLNN